MTAAACLERAEAGHPAGAAVIQMLTWPEHVTGERAITGKRQRDHATCAWDGREYRVLTLSATTALARVLVAAGCPDQPWEARTPTGTHSLYGPSLHAWAGRIVTEDDRGFHLRVYSEHPLAGSRNEVQTARAGLAGAGVAGEGRSAATHDLRERGVTRVMMFQPDGARVGLVYRRLGARQTGQRHTMELQQ